MKSSSLNDLSRQIGDKEKARSSWSFSRFWPFAFVLTYSLIFVTLSNDFILLATMTTIHHHKIAWWEFGRYLVKNDESEKVAVPWGYQSPSEVMERSSRFPSVEQRVQVYLSNWYAPPCDPSDAFHFDFHIDPSQDPSKSTRGKKQQQEIFPHLFIREPLSLPPPTTYVAVGEMLHARLVYYDERIFASGCKRCHDVAATLTPILSDNKTNTVFSLSRDQNNSAGNMKSGSAEFDEHLISLKLNSPPILLQFGDRVMPEAYIPSTGRNGNVMTIPYLSKVRHAVPRDALDTWIDEGFCRSGPSMLNGKIKNTSVPFPLMQPVVWKLSYERHYGMLPQIPVSDIPWEDKIDGAVFRGSPTGLKKGLIPNGRRMSSLSPDEKCALMPRCQLVVRCAQSTYMSQHLNVALTGGKYDLPAAYFGDSMNLTQQLLYKAVIVVEGNDMATGFKWALYSNSVVMSPKPRFTSWAMEELLEPWVHYIPLADDFSDIEEKVQWMLDHDDEAQAVAHRGQLWINDLVFHPDVATEDQQVFRRVVSRLQAHFSQRPGLALETLASTT